MAPSSSRPALALAALCLCAFAVNLDVTMVNVTLPTLVDRLHAGTSRLQWIVDAYTLVFASLVLVCGSLADRLGRRRMLIAGLVVYGTGNGLAALASSSDQLVAMRALMGLGAAMIFPTTLSLIVTVYTERTARAKAIGVWGAVTGLAVALGPIAGGALIESATWQSTFLVKVPLALVAVGAVLTVVPTSKDPTARRLDRLGFALSTLAIGLVTYALIEAPGAGWSSARTLGLLAAGLLAAAAFIGWERRATTPMVDLRLFGDLRFTGGSLAVTVGFFSLAGFIFLIVQYMQFVKGWGPLETGLRTLPVAVAIAVGATAGAQIALRAGTKAVVTCGLLLYAAAYGWISTEGIDTSYTTIAGQMILLGSGMGLTSAPATEAIMGAVGLDRAGVGSAVNDTTRELGSTLGVAIMGSVYASLYAKALRGDVTQGVPARAVHAAQDSIGGALTAVARLGDAGAGAGAGAALRGAAFGGFIDGLQLACLVAAGVCVVGAAACALLLPAQPPSDTPDATPEPGHARNGSAGAGLGSAGDEHRGSVVAHLSPPGTWSR